MNNIREDSGLNENEGIHHWKNSSRRSRKLLLTNQNHLWEHSRVLLHKTNKTSWQFFSELRKGCYWLKRFIKLFTVELENSVHHLVEFFTLTLLWIERCKEASKWFKLLVLILGPGYSWAIPSYLPVKRYLSTPAFYGHTCRLRWVASATRDRLFPALTFLKPLWFYFLLAGP